MSSAAALAAGVAGVAGSARRPRTDFRVRGSVKNSLVNIRKRAGDVWKEVQRMQDTIDSLQAENARLQGILHGAELEPDDYDSDQQRDSYLERNYRRINNSRFFAARQSSAEE